MKDFLERLSAPVSNTTSTPAPMFDNREVAGRQLAATLQDRGITADTIVAVAPTGVPAGTVIAQEQDIPIGIAVANRIDAPFEPDQVIGGVTADGGVWIDDTAVDELSIGAAYIEDGIRVEQDAAAAEQQRYDTEPVDVAGSTVLVVDDGIMDAAAVMAVCDQLEEHGAARIIVAAPVISDGVRDLIPYDTVAVTRSADDQPITAFYREHDELSPAEIQSYLG